MDKLNILITTTSFQDTPGNHHKFLAEQDWDIDFLRGPLSESELLPIIKKYDAIICGYDEYSKEVLMAGKNGKLKVISKYGVGLDRIDLKKANELGIKVTNVPGINQVSVSEHVLALLFSFSKNILSQHQSVQNGIWRREIGFELQGKTIGIIGLGAVGKEVSKKSLAIGMRVMAFDIVKDKIFLDEHSDIKFVTDLDTIYEKCDIISLHLPHNNSSDKLINDYVIKTKLKKQPIIINTSRGKLVEPKAIICGIKNKLIKGYLCDVLNEEPITKKEILINVENVIITPHVGSRTYENVEKQGIYAIKNLKNSL